MNNIELSLEIKFERLQIDFMAMKENRDFIHNICIEKQNEIDLLNRKLQKAIEQRNSWITENDFIVSQSNAQEHIEVEDDELEGIK